MYHLNTGQNTFVPSLTLFFYNRTNKNSGITTRQKIGAVSMKPFSIKPLNSFQIIVLGFAGVILAGALLLMLPVSSATHCVTPFLSALFTSTTSVCVTGLIVVDTGTYWSVFGQAVILVLIQIGGMGVVTVAAAVTIVSGRKIGLMQRSTMQEAVAAPKMSGIVRLTGFIIRATLLIELSGAALLAPVFCRDFGPIRGLWMAVFHSISAFCNAGIDLMGIRIPFSSLTLYAANPLVNLVIMALIIIGGIGFLTWEDIRSNHLHFSRYRMQSKVILTTTAILILLPALYFYFGEFRQGSFGTRILLSLFQSVTPRTAGFNTADFSKLTESGQMLTIILMLIGGSPGSTAGGMKTTTLAVLTATAVSVFRRNETPELFKRRIATETVANAASILMMYLSLCLTGAFLISRIEELPMMACMFETASAVGTVGLSFGITPGLGSISRIILIILMYLGRVGGLTLIYAALSGHRIRLGKYPLEKITVG